MRILSVGDIHGKDIWKSINPDKYDKIIFIGDYVDAFEHSDIEILHNLKEIIEFKKQNSDKVILLLGNHDIQYMFSYNKYGCSGYRSSMYPILHTLFNEERELFLPSYYLKGKNGDYLWTHAGLHEGWYTQHFYPKFIHTNDALKNLSIDEIIYVAFLREEPTLFQVGHLRGGFSDVGGIFWADKRLTAEKPLKGYHQIVGHTRVDENKTYKKDENTSITFIDSLDNENSRFYEQIIKL